MSTLVYDGDCAFCTRCIGLVRRMPTTATIVPWQHADLAALGSTAERASYELLWVAADGRVTGGAQAVASLLRDCGGLWWPLGAVLRVPPVRWLAHGVYRLVANNRERMPGGTAACAVPPRSAR